MEIPFRGQIDVGVLRRMNLTSMTPGRSTLIFFGVFGLLFLLAVITPLFSGGTVSFEGFGTVLLFLLLFAAAIAYSLYVAPRKVLQSSTLLQSPIQGEVKETGIRVETEHSRSEIPWDAFLKRKIGKDIVLLYQSIQVVNIFPKEFFAGEADWLAFVDLVRQRVPEKAPKNRGGGRLSMTLKALLIWMVLFVIVILLWNFFQR
jgi:hypothetical protein